MRANAENPALSLVNITLNKGNASNNFNDGDQNIADFALEYRFLLKASMKAAIKSPTLWVKPAVLIGTKMRVLVKNI